ncbi:uncharacterized protein YhbP (UPF0306 family) [Stackebrandtia endophytica]|uniref:Uncharacterized protein YhbP (UPF0306 family) n=1 Tax=Stackebrandtia endophytica TaxID=1496996 RepID=A0A543ATB9_9ACTN|nr:pyridoxamine 5'-phosphate oxidase family protein [Stackebrandtia endophytica]TQL75755.1 uncharacterized protein YhbP (UPF0306 family) [Stackebrandtia endophytica]
MSHPRKLLDDYVTQAKVMQLATTDADGAPVVCNLWFASGLRPDRLWFISRENRIHCDNLRERPKVAGSILDTMLDELGGTPVRGVTFTGTARQLPTTGVDQQIDAYLSRWPKAHNAIDPERLANRETHHRIYQIDVTAWVLYDEIGAPKAPRQPVPAE